MCLLRAYVIVLCTELNLVMQRINLHLSFKCVSHQYGTKQQHIVLLSISHCHPCHLCVCRTHTCMHLVSSIIHSPDGYYMYLYMYQQAFLLPPRIMPINDSSQLMVPDSPSLSLPFPYYSGHWVTLPCTTQLPAACQSTRDQYKWQVSTNATVWQEAKVRAEWSRSIKPLSCFHINQKYGADHQAKVINWGVCR